jgi:hypothetical protein
MEEYYCIANAADLSRADLAGMAGQSNAGMTRILADQVLADYLELAPDLTGDLLVVAEHELAEAA